MPLGSSNSLGRKNFRAFPVVTLPLRIVGRFSILSHVVIMVKAIRNANQPTPCAIFRARRVERIQCGPDVRLPCVRLDVWNLVNEAARPENSLNALRLVQTNQMTL